MKNVVSEEGEVEVEEEEEEVTVAFSTVVFICIVGVVGAFCY